MPSLSVQDVSNQSRLVFLFFEFHKASQAPGRGRCRRMTERQRGLLNRKTRGSWTIIVWDPRTRVRMPRCGLAVMGEWGSGLGEAAGGRARGHEDAIGCSLQLHLGAAGRSSVSIARTTGTASVSCGETDEPGR